MSKKINPLAINISFNKLEFCNDKTPGPLTFPFPPTAVSEMEIVSREELKSKMSAFFSEHQIHAMPVVLVLNESMYYSKDFLTTMPPAQEDVQKFLDLVPFAGVSYRVYRLPIGHRLVVINREFYEIFKNILLSLGFSIISVVPSFIVTGTGPTTAFSSQTCILINKKLDVIMENSFGGQEVAPTAAGNTHKFIEGHKTVVTIFAVLVILACPVILFFYFQAQAAQQKAKKKTVVNTVVLAKPTLVPTPTQTVGQKYHLDSLTLHLLNASGISGLAASLEADFRNLGFTKITTGNFPKSTATSIVFKPDVSLEVRDVVQKMLSAKFQNISVKDNQQTQFDITITTGKLLP